jgi:hypothetical protein
MLHNNEGDTAMTFKFGRNLGMTDRILRGGIGIAMIYFGFFSKYLITDYLAGLILGSMGIGMLLIAVIGYCPLYGLIGFSTFTPKPESAR